MKLSFGFVPKLRKGLSSLASYAFSFGSKPEPCPTDSCTTSFSASSMKPLLGRTSPVPSRSRRINKFGDKTRKRDRLKSLLDRKMRRLSRKVKRTRLSREQLYQPIPLSSSQTTPPAPLSVVERDEDIVVPTKLHFSRFRLSLIDFSSSFLNNDSSSAIFSIVRRRFESEDLLCDANAEAKRAGGSQNGLRSSLIKKFAAKPATKPASSCTTVGPLSMYHHYRNLMWCMAALRTYQADDSAERMAFLNSCRSVLFSQPWSQNAPIFIDAEISNAREELDDKCPEWKREDLMVWSLKPITPEERERELDLAMNGERWIIHGVVMPLKKKKNRNGKSRFLRRPMKIVPVESDDLDSLYDASLSADIAPTVPEITQEIDELATYLEKELTLDERDIACAERIEPRALDTSGLQSSGSPSTPVVFPKSTRRELGQSFPEDEDYFSDSYGIKVYHWRTLTREQCQKEIQLALKGERVMIDDLVMPLKKRKQSTARLAKKRASIEKVVSWKPLSEEQRQMEIELAVQGKRTVIDGWVMPLKKKSRGKTAKTAQPAETAKPETAAPAPATPMKTRRRNRKKVVTERPFFAQSE